MDVKLILIDLGAVSKVTRGTSTSHVVLDATISGCIMSGFSKTTTCGS
jgi:hypothetical protein